MLHVMLTKSDDWYRGKVPESEFSDEFSSGECFDATIEGSDRGITPYDLDDGFHQHRS